MTKFLGMIGYSAGTVETSPGVFEDIEVEQEHRGEVLRDVSMSRPTGQVNDNIVLSQKVSIVADAQLDDMFPRMLYVVIKGHRWTVKSVEFQRPRAILTIGGIYNG